jgi:GNAT superfamily N-acetyltransferase
MTEHPTGIIDRITIRDFCDSDSLVDLTQLLNTAYGFLQRMGLKFTATYQGIDITRKRVEAGRCFVVELDREIVGTISYYDPSRADGCGFYQRPDVSKFAQLAIKPDLQRLGLATKLVKLVEEQARKDGSTFLALDTAEPAKHLIDWYTRLGYEFISYHQWPVTNYRSVVMAKRVGKGTNRG